MMPITPERSTGTETLPGNNECMRCGYDLRGIGIDGNCPECGHSVSASRQHQLKLLSRVYYRRAITYLVCSYPIPFTTYALIGLILLGVQAWWGPQYDENAFATFLVLGEPAWGFSYWLGNELYSAFNWADWLPYRRLSNYTFGLILCATLDAALMLIRNFNRSAGAAG